MPRMRTEDGVELNYHVDGFRDPWAICLGDTTLMAHGFGQSPPCPLGAPSSTQKQIHNARLVAFSNVGSSIQLLIPDRCLEEVMGFLKELEAKRGSGPRVRIACA